MSKGILPGPFYNHHAVLVSCIIICGACSQARCPGQVGKRKTSVTVLAGSVVRVWGTLEATLSRHEHSLSKSDRMMRALHVTFADGANSLIGRDLLAS